MKSSLKIENRGNKMNKVILLGRLTKEPELRQTTSGTAVCNINIAVKRRFAKDGQQNADFINCTAFGSNAEFICRYFTQGTPIAIVGELRIDNYEKDGIRRYTTSVIIDEVHFAGKKEG